MTKRIEVHSQAEFDVCVKAGNIAVVVGCSVVARENSHVVAWENSHVEAWENSHVEAWGSSHVVARGNSHVEAWGSSHVVARGNSHVVAWENSHVEAWGSSHVVARGNSHVVARGNSHVVAWENSHVEAWGNSHVEAWGNSHVEAWGNSHVVAWGNVFIRLWSALSIKASAHVAILVHGRAETLEGGNQIQAMKEPETGAEWCEYWGLDPRTAPYRIPNIDAALLASIEKHKATNGLNMSSWHGSECDETNWCNTTHCRAGYAICLAGKPGFDLEKKYGSEAAGKMIYAVSRPDKPLPNFHDTNAGAMADIKACAAER